MYANLEAHNEEHIVWKKTAAMMIRLLKKRLQLVFFLFFTAMFYFYVYAVSFFPDTEKFKPSYIIT
jgi:hypothetical protein